MCDVFYFLFLCLQVQNLTPGAVYQFRVYGANVIGLGDASPVSAPFICEAWNMPEPGNEPHTHILYIKKIWYLMKALMQMKMLLHS